jgi:hypothetical protein
MLALGDHRSGQRPFTIASPPGARARCFRAGGRGQKNGPQRWQSRGAGASEASTRRTRHGTNVPRAPGGWRRSARVRRERSEMDVGFVEATPLVERTREPRRQVDDQLVRSVHDLAKRSATYPELRRLPAYPTASRARLHARVGRRLTPTEEWLLGVLRRAWRGGKPAVHCSVGELALLTARCERSIQNALRGLGPCRSTCAPGCVAHVDLVRRIPVFDSVSWCDVASRRTYRRRQRANVLMLTRHAPRPGRPRRPHAAATPPARPPAPARAQQMGSVPRRSPGPQGSSGGKTCTPTAPPDRRRVGPGSAAAPSPSVARAPAPAAAPAAELIASRGVAAAPPEEVPASRADRSVGLTADSENNTDSPRLAAAGRMAGPAPTSASDSSASSASSGLENEASGRPSADELLAWRRAASRELWHVSEPPPRRELLAELERVRARLGPIAPAAELDDQERDDDQEPDR